MIGKTESLKIDGADVFICDDVKYHGLTVL